MRPKLLFVTTWQKKDILSWDNGLNFPCHGHDGTLSRHFLCQPLLSDCGWVDFLFVISTRSEEEAGKEPGCPVYLIRILCIRLWSSHSLSCRDSAGAALSGRTVTVLAGLTVSFPYNSDNSHNGGHQSTLISLARLGLSQADPSYSSTQLKSSQPQHPTSPQELGWFDLGGR